MDLEAKVGQLFFVGFDGTADGSDLREYIAEVRPGGVILFARNIVDARQVRALNEALLSTSEPPPFIAVDQEGGRVSRLRAVLPPLPSAAQLAALQEEEIREYARALGVALAALGFNTDFAPVVDLSSPGAPSGIGDRSFGEDAHFVSRCARAFIDGLTGAHIASFVKHFPGLGATDLDSHLALPVCYRDGPEMWARDLLPFRSCAPLAAGVMVAHVHCPFYDPDRALPATLSESVVTDLLRGRMSYEGIALTDDLEMGAVAGPPPEELAILALLAGNDMVMFCNSTEKALAARRGVLAELRSGARLSEEKIDRSVERILAAKSRFAIGGPSEKLPEWESALHVLSSYAVA